MSWLKVLILSLTAFLLVGLGAIYWGINHAEVDIYVPMFADHCAGCHGDDLRGTERGVALIERQLDRGDSVDALTTNIRQGHAGLGQEAFLTELSDLEIKGLAIYIGERRLGHRSTLFQSGS